MTDGFYAWGCNWLIRQLKGTWVYLLWRMQLFVFVSVPITLIECITTTSGQLQELLDRMHLCFRQLSNRQFGYKDLSDKVCWWAVKATTVLIFIRRNAKLASCRSGWNWPRAEPGSARLLKRLSGLYLIHYTARFCRLEAHTLSSDGPSPPIFAGMNGPTKQGKEF